jgi:phage terminase small subunit
MPALTAQQERFCNEYIIDLIGSAAAERAGYASSNARAQASRLLKNDSVKQRIAELQASRAERVEVTQDMVISGLLKEARFEGEGSSHSARITAWTNLGKHLGMFRERF